MMAMRSVLDNFFTSSQSQILSIFMDNHFFELMRHDVTFPLYVEVDEIYNLACPASPVHYQFDPVQTTKTSVHGAINMLGLAKRVKAKILQASTSEVYGTRCAPPNTRTTGEMSTLSDQGHATMRENVVRKRSSLIITASIR